MSPWHGLLCALQGTILHNICRNIPVVTIPNNPAGIRGDSVTRPHPTSQCFFISRFCGLFVFLEWKFVNQKFYFYFFFFFNKRYRKHKFMFKMTVEQSAIFFSLLLLLLFLLLNSPVNIHYKPDKSKRRFTLKL